ncbi:acyl-CoA thioesterase [Microvirga sp. 2TAF3]|uniref:acyl-CoA thioesterase n=1 Tax=Microvirga sp. 2TAF3 TaxID=3233014 RepID=UPI003F9D606B
MTAPDVVAAEVPPIFTHWTEDRIRISDLDFQKHVNNATFTALFANARFDFLSKVVRPLIGADDQLVIARLEVDFKGSLAYGEPVKTGTAIARVGTRSLNLAQVMKQSDRQVALAKAVFVLVDGTTRQSAAWPEAVRRLVENRDALSF